MEGGLAFNAWMASKNSQVYGGVAALPFPIVTAGTKNTALFWVSLAGAEAFTIYNIGLTKDKYSEREIFKKNMIGWHLLAGFTGVAVLTS